MSSPTGGARCTPSSRRPGPVGVEYLEFDLQMTADNVLLVTHGQDVSRVFCAAPAGTGLIQKSVRG